MTKEGAREAYMNRMCGVNEDDDEDEDASASQPIPQPTPQIRGENHGNTRLPYGLCKEAGIDVPEGTTPYEAYQLLREGTGVTHDKVLKHVAETGTVEGLKDKSGTSMGHKNPPKQEENPSANQPIPQTKTNFAEGAVPRMAPSGAVGAPQTGVSPSQGNTQGNAQRPAGSVSGAPSGVLWDNPAPATNGPVGKPIVAAENPQVSNPETTTWKEEKPNAPQGNAPQGNVPHEPPQAEQRPRPQAGLQKPSPRGGTPKTPKEASQRAKRAVHETAENSKAFAKDPFHTVVPTPQEEFDELQNYVKDQLDVATKNHDAKGKSYWEKQAKVLDAAAKRNGFISLFNERVNKPIGQAQVATKNCRVSAGGIAKLLTAVIATLISPQMGRAMTGLFYPRTAKSHEEKPITQEKIEKTVKQLKQKKAQFDFEEEHGENCFKAFNADTLEYDEEGMNSAVNEMMNSEYAKANPSAAQKVRKGVEEYYKNVGMITRQVNAIMNNPDLSNDEKKAKVHAIGEHCKKISDEMYNGKHETFANGTQVYRCNMAATLSEIGKKFGA